MTKPPIASEENTIQPNVESKPTPSSSSAYAESVRMTKQRLIDAVIKNSRQGGSSEH
jgi:hypothetical protein